MVTESVVGEVVLEVPNNRVKMVSAVDSIHNASPESKAVRMERFWKHLRRQVTHNHFFQTMERLMDAVLSFFQDMAASPESVRSVAGLAA
jgi:hypothetical protein